MTKANIARTGIPMPNPTMPVMTLKTIECRGSLAMHTQ